jgi:hypothetical protein
MPYEHHVVPLLPDRWRRRVTDEERRVTSGELGAGEVDHRRGAVHPGDTVSLLGGEERQAAGAAAEVEDVGRPRGQPGTQSGSPCLTDLRVPQPVVRLVVEGGGRGVPVHRRSSDGVFTVRHTPQTDTRH